MAQKRAAMPCGMGIAAAFTWQNQADLSMPLSFRLLHSLNLQPQPEGWVCPGQLVNGADFFAGIYDEAGLYGLLEFL